MDVDNFSLALGIGLGVFFSGIVYALSKLDKDDDERS